MSTILKIVGVVVSALFTSWIAYVKQLQLEAQAAKANALQQYVDSLKASQAAQDQVDVAVAEHQAAQAQVVSMQEKLDALRRWNDRVRNLGSK
jgi:hypothetical protein